MSEKDNQEDGAPSPKNIFHIRKRKRSSNISVSSSFDNLHQTFSKRRMSQHITPNFFKEELMKEVPVTNQIVDQFLLIGLPLEADINENDKSTRKPKILMVMPSAPLVLDPNDYDKVVDFCFPTGFGHFGDITNQPYILSQFVFRIIKTVDGTNIPVYGICTQFDISRTKNLSFFYDSESKNYPFCFCFLSTNPVISLTLQYSCFLALWCNLRNRNIIRADAQQAFDKPTAEETTLLPGLVWGGGSQRIPSMRIPRLFLQELHYFLSLHTLKSTPQNIMISTTIAATVPMTDSPANYILYPSLSYLFSSLSLRNIMKVYSSMLLDDHLLFLSAYPLRLTLSVLSAVELLAPFKPSVIVMPIIPNKEDFLPLLESPTPYVIGFVNRNGITLPESDITVVNLDNNTVYCKKNLPLFPQYKELEETIKGILDQNKEAITVPPRSIKKKILGKKEDNPAFKEFFHQANDMVCPRITTQYNLPKYIFTEQVVLQIVQAFKDCFPKHFYKSISSCFVSDTTDINNPVTIFHRDLFFDAIPQEHKPFYEFFLNCQIFTQFCDLKTDEIETNLQYESESASPLNPMRRRRKTISPLNIDSTNDSYFAENELLESEEDK